MTQTTSRHPSEFDCPACGATVGWRTTRDGVLYVASLSQRYDNGARYSRGAHRDVCDRIAAERQAAREAAREREAALAAAVRRMEALRRWNAVYGDEFRAWVEVDRDAAAAHFTALTDRVLATHPNYTPTAQTATWDDATDAMSADDPRNIAREEAAADDRENATGSRD